jgi:hypothetical protein
MLILILKMWFVTAMLIVIAAGTVLPCKIDADSMETFCLDLMDGDPLGHLC